MRVPLLDLKPQYQSIKAELDAALQRIVESQRFILGPAVSELEERIAAYSGARHGVGVSSGTDALLASLMALEIGAGDEVVTSPYTFFATAGAIARSGAQPVFIDVEPTTFNVNAELVRRFLEEDCERRAGGLYHRESGGRVRALMPVHLFGQAAEMEPLMALASEHGLAVIEDAAQSLGAECSPGRRVGGIGDVGCLSFFPSKNLGAFGDAGMCVTNDDGLAARLRMLRVHGMEPKYRHPLIGGNFRLDELQAAVLLVKLPHLEAWHAAKQRHAAYYEAALRAAGVVDRVRSPVARPGTRHVFHQYVVRVPDRDRLRAQLAQDGIGTEIYYPVPLHLQPCFASLGYRPEDCPEAARAARETLALPIYPELTEAQLQYVVDSIVRFLKSS